MSDYVHIVALDAPSPPDYGGAIDIYYKIVALSKIGKKVILHYFDYKAGRGAQDVQRYCYKVFRYKRQTGLSALSLRLPYIVHSRKNEELINRLNEDAYPVILEGIHCTGIVKNISRPNRKVVVRLHNNEALYYKTLAKTSKSLFKKLYYLMESYLLNQYQRALPKDICIAALSLKDLRDFQNLHFTNLHFIPGFLPWQQISSPMGNGAYCLYHGNMTVSENEEVAGWLIDNIFSKCSIPFIIAGKGISSRMAKKAYSIKNIEIISDPTEDRMATLISNAQLHLLPSFNITGVKLKLLNALFNGRFCMTNQAGVAGSDINSGIIIMKDGKEMIEQVKHFFTISFSESELQQRKLLLQTYDNHINALKLNALIS